MNRTWIENHIVAEEARYFEYVFCKRARVLYVIAFAVTWFLGDLSVTALAHLVAPGKGTLLAAAHLLGPAWGVAGGLGAMCLRGWWFIVKEDWDRREWF